MSFNTAPRKTTTRPILPTTPTITNQLEPDKESRVQRILTYFFLIIIFLIGIILILSAKGGTAGTRTQSSISQDSSSDLMKKVAIYGLKQIASRCDGGPRFWTHEELEDYVRHKFAQLPETEFDTIYRNILIKLAEERKASSFKDYKETRSREGELVEESSASVVLPETIVYFSQERVISVSCRFKQIGSFLWIHYDSILLGNLVASLVLFLKYKLFQYYSESEVNSKYVT